MSVTTPAHVTGRVRAIAHDTWILTLRDLAHWVRRPAPLIVSLLFPVMTVLMFGYLFGGALSVPGGGNYREFLMPGMFAMTMLFGTEVTMAAVVTDATRGVTDRFRVMPMVSGAVVLGRSAADMLNSALGLVIMVVCGWAVGWQSRNGIPALLAALGLLLLLRFALIWVGIYLGLVASGPEAVVMLQILVWPLGFLSNAFVAPSTMPGWLGTVVAWNPLSATVAACRELFGNPGAGGDAWVMANAVPMAVAWPLLIIAIFLPLSVARYRRLGR